MFYAVLQSKVQRKCYGFEDLTKQNTKEMLTFPGLYKAKCKGNAKVLGIAQNQIQRETNVLMIVPSKIQRGFKGFDN